MTLGFVGVGTIASAMVRGLCSDMSNESRIICHLSPRNVAKSAQLALEFPGRVRLRWGRARGGGEEGAREGREDRLALLCLPCTHKLKMPSLSCPSQAIVASSNQEVVNLSSTVVLAGRSLPRVCAPWASASRTKLAHSPCPVARLTLSSPGSGSDAARGRISDPPSPLSGRGPHPHRHCYDSL